MDAPCKNVKLRDPPSHLECVETLDLGAKSKDTDAVFVSQTFTNILLLIDGDW